MRRYLFCAMGKMKEDMATMEQSERKVQEVAKYYADKYNEANEVLKLCNTEKTTLVQERKN